MNTLQLHNILSQDAHVGPVFKGVHPADGIPPLNSGAYVINTAPSTESQGHWVALWVSSKDVEYFDSYGQTPSSCIQVKLKGRRVTCNDQMLQSPLSAVCGQYAVYYLLHRSRGMSLASILKDFGSDVDDNDQYVYDFMEQSYDLDATLVDTPGFVQQMAQSLYRK